MTSSLLVQVLISLHNGDEEHFSMEEHVDFVAYTNAFEFIYNYFSISLPTKAMYVQLRITIIYLKCEWCG